MDGDERCCVCNVPLGFFVPSAREAHVNACLDAEGCSADDLHAEADVRCSVCDQNLASLSTTAREVHVNRCLDRTLPPTAVSRENRRENASNGSSLVASRRGRAASKKATGPELCSKMKMLLGMVGLERYEKRFAAQEIDIAALQLLEDGDWIELGLPEGARRRLTDAARHAKLLEMRALVTPKSPSRATDKKTHAPTVNVDDGNDDDNVNGDNDRDGDGFSVPELPSSTQPFGTSNLGAAMARRQGHLLAGMAGRLHCDDDDDSDDCGDGVHADIMENEGDGEGHGNAGNACSHKLYEASTGLESETLGRPEVGARDTRTGAESHDLQSEIAHKLRESRGYTQLESFLDEVDANQDECDDASTGKLPLEDVETPIARNLHAVSNGRSNASCLEGESSLVPGGNSRKYRRCASWHSTPAEATPEAIEVIEISPEHALPRVSSPEKDSLSLPQPDIELPSNQRLADGVDVPDQRCRSGVQSQHSGAPGEKNSARCDSGFEVAASTDSKTHRVLPLGASRCRKEGPIVVSDRAFPQRDEDGGLCREGVKSDNSSHSGVLDLARSDEVSASPASLRVSGDRHPTVRSTDDISPSKNALSRTSIDSAVLDLAGSDRGIALSDQVRASVDDNVAVLTSNQCPCSTEAEVNRWFCERRNDEIRRHRAVLERLEVERQRACEAAVDYEGRKLTSPGLLGKRSGASVLESDGCAEAPDEPERSAGESSDSVLDLTQRGELSERDENVAEKANDAGVPARTAASRDAAKQDKEPQKKKKKKKKASAPRPPPASDEDLVSVIRSNRELHDKMLLVEPVMLESVVNLVKEAGFRISVANLAAFLDRQGVNYKVAPKESTEAGREYMKQLNSQL